MGYALSFAAFLAAILACLLSGRSIAWALGLALALFFLVSLRRGYRPGQLIAMIRGKMPAAMIVMRILFLIGILTGLWRSCGTIAFCIYHGIRMITPPLFILVAFLLTVLLSYALGTSFGVTSTAGVVLMALARTGGVPPAIAAGAILSGVYFGDRGAPTSSCASLVAALTETDLYGNVKRMFKTAALPYVLCLLFYTVLSLQNPTTAVDNAMLPALAENFDLSLWAVLPAVLMIALPLLRVPIRIAMAISGAVAFAVTTLLQDVSVWETAKICVLGYHPMQGLLTDVLSGGGLVSMVTALFLIPLSAANTGILEGTGALDAVQEKLHLLCRRIGRLPTMNLLCIAASMVFCNQTVVVMMAQQLMKSEYQSAGAEHEEMAMDIANSGVMTAGLVPWCIACAIPLSMLGVGAEALPYAALLYLVPICYLFTKRFFYPEMGERSANK